MRDNPFVRFQRTAEAAGYPALLIVSALCLGIVVAAVALLALAPSAVGLAFAVLNLVAAIGLLAGAILAAVADVEDPDAEDVVARTARPQASTVVPFAAGGPPAQPHPADRRAA